jgi:hypothetical protein
MTEIISSHPFLSFFTIWILASCVTRMWESSFGRKETVGPETEDETP